MSSAIENAAEFVKCPDKTKERMFGYGRRSYHLHTQPQRIAGPTDIGHFVTLETCTGCPSYGGMNSDGRHREDGKRVVCVLAKAGGMGSAPAYKPEDIRFLDNEQPQPAAVMEAMRRFGEIRRAVRARTGLELSREPGAAETLGMLKEIQERHLVDYDF